MYLDELRPARAWRADRRRVQNGKQVVKCVSREIEKSLFSEEVRLQQREIKSEKSGKIS